MQLIPGFTTQARNDGCSFCGNGPGKTVPNDPKSPDREVILSGTDIDYEGSFEFCLDCARQIGSLVGMISEEQAKALRSERDHAVSHETAAVAERDAARRALAALREELALWDSPPPPERPAPAKKAPARKAAAGAPA